MSDFWEYIKRIGGASIFVISAVLIVPGVYQLSTGKSLITGWAVWCLLAVVLVFAKGFLIYREQQETLKEREKEPDFELNVTGLRIVNHRKQVQDERVFYLADCRVDIAIENLTPNAIWLRFDLNVVDTNLPPTVIKNDDIRFVHTQTSRGRESQDKTPMQIAPNEIIDDGMLRTKLEMELTPVEKMVPKLGCASSLAVEVRASQSKDKYVIRQIVSDAAVGDFIEKVEEGLIADIRNNTHQTIWLDGVQWLKLLWKGEESHAD